MTDQQFRLECLRMASALVQTQVTHKVTGTSYRDATTIADAYYAWVVKKPASVRDE